MYGAHAGYYVMTNKEGVSTSHPTWLSGSILGRLGLSGNFGHEKLGPGDQYSTNITVPPD